MTSRCGAFAGGEETMYLNPDKLQKDLNEMFVGKTLKWWVDEDD